MTVSYVDVLSSWNEEVMAQALQMYQEVVQEVLLR